MDNERSVTPQAEPGESEPRKEWRCFGCDFVTSDPQEAEAHFGDGDEASEFVPVCKWWTNSTDDEHKRAYQDLIIELNQARDDCQPAAAPEQPAAVPQASAGLSDEEIARKAKEFPRPKYGHGHLWGEEHVVAFAAAAIAEVRQRDGERIAELEMWKKQALESFKKWNSLHDYVQKNSPAKYLGQYVQEVVPKWIAEAEARADSLGEQLEYDRTQVAAGITAIKKAVDERHWLTEGRGPYEWDDDRWHGEFKAAAIEILNAVKPLAKIAADWSNCPQSAEAIAKARIDLKAERDSLAATLEKVNHALAQYGMHAYHECLYHWNVVDRIWEHRGAITTCRCGLADTLASLSPVPGMEDKAG